MGTPASSDFGTMDLENLADNLPIAVFHKFGCPCNKSVPT